MPSCPSESRPALDRQIAQEQEAAQLEALMTTYATTISFYTGGNLDEVFGYLEAGLCTKAIKSKEPILNIAQGHFHQVLMESINQRRREGGMPHLNPAIAEDDAVAAQQKNTDPSYLEAVELRNAVQGGKATKSRNRKGKPFNHPRRLR